MSRMLNWIAPCGGLTRKFAKARDGVLPVIFAIAVIPGISLLGMAVDFAGGRAEKSKLQAAADAAVLEALTASERLESEAGTEGDFIQSGNSYKPIARGVELFMALAADASSAKNATVKIQVERKAQKYTALLTYSADYMNRMPSVIGASKFTIEGLASSTLTVSGSGYLDIHTLLDTSSSMGIGASPTDIAKLEAWKEGPNYNWDTKKGCAFSCHGEKPADVMLRIDVMRDAVTDMIKSAEAEYKKQEVGEAARIRIAINKFDHQPFTVEALTSDYSKLLEDMHEIRLHPWDHRGTDMKRALNWLNPKVPASGNGLSPSSPRRFVFIVTDGMQDRYPAWQARNFPGPTGAGTRTGPVDPAACSDLKSKGVTVAILYTTQVGIKGYEWYWQNPQPSIRPNLMACASDNFFFEASNAAQLSTEFKKMFKKAVQATNARIDK